MTSIDAGSIRRTNHDTADRKGNKEIGWMEEENGRIWKAAEGTLMEPALDTKESGTITVFGIRNA